jgi:hypothetical protein
MTAWFRKLTSKFTGGKISEGNNVFLIKLEFPVMTWALEFRISAKVAQGINPQRKTRIKGIPSLGWTLKPREKINQ